MSKRGRPVSRKRSIKAPSKKAAPKMAAVPSQLDKTLSSLDGMSMASLRRVMSACERLLERKAEGERKSFVEEVTSRAAGLGMSIADLLKRAVPDVVLPSSRLPQKKAGTKQASSGVKFRNPKTGETWSGRGRTAGWLVKLEAQGRKRNEFAV